MDDERPRETAASGDAPVAEPRQAMPPEMGFVGRSRARTSRGVIAGWIVGVALVVALGITAGVVHVSAHRSFDSAVAALDDATDEATAEGRSLGIAAGDGADAAAAADVIVASAADDLVDVAMRTAFADVSAATSATVDAAQGLLREPVSLPSTAKPFWTWELWSRTERLEDATSDLEAISAEMREAGETLEDADEALVAAALTLYATVPPQAAALEAANISARTNVVLDLRDAAEAASGQTAVGSGAASAFRTLADRAASLKASAQAELAEKAGRLLGTRLEIEAYARSIAGGVVLDFDWAPLVNGLGGAAGMSGTATWNTARGGFSTITLSDSVAENWPSADARALVAHEVGHSITSKCSRMFDSDDKDANEAWATAWAISMGHDTEGSGTQAYGYPPQSLIDVAATCR